MGEDIASLSPAPEAYPSTPSHSTTPARPKSRMGLFPSLINRFERSNNTSACIPTALHSPVSGSSGSEPPTSAVENSTPTTSPENSSFVGSQPGVAVSTMPRSDGMLGPPMRADDTQSMLDIVDEPECPLCLEPLSLRLRGERYVVPRCGHTIHHECFTAMYGNPKSILARQQRQRQLEKLGPAPVSCDDGLVCQVCRRRLELSPEVAVGQKVERVTGMMRDLAAVTGLRDSLASDNSDTHLIDPNGDDTAEPQKAEGRMLRPSLTIEPEFDTLWKRASPNERDGLQTFPTLLRVSVPRRRPGLEPAIPMRREPRPAKSFDSGESSVCPLSSSSAATSSVSAVSSTTSASSASSHRRPQRSSLQAYPPSLNGEISTFIPPRVEETPKPYIQINKDLYDLPEEETLSSSSPQALDHFSLPSFDVPPRPAPPPPEVSTVDGAPPVNPDATVAALRKRVKDDLCYRMADWKGHHLDNCGELQMMDTLDVFKQHTVRRFSVYMFEQAILCTLEDHRRPLAPPLSVPKPSVSDSSDSGGGPHSASAPPLRLKGWIYFRHMQSVTNSSTLEQPSLSIQMVDKKLDQFVLVFESHQQAQVWYQQMVVLSEAARNPNQAFDIALPSTFSGRVEELDPVPAARGSDISQTNMTFDGDGLISSGISNSASSSTLAPHPLTLPGMPAYGSVHESSRSIEVPHSARSSISSDRPLEAIVNHALDPHSHDLGQWRSLYGFDSLDPPQMLSHSSIDLVLMVVLPNRTEAGITTQDGLRCSLLRSTLELILHSLGEKDRLSLVAFCPGLRSNGAYVAKTRLLRVGVGGSRDVLLEFLDMLAAATLHEAEHLLEDLSQYPSSGASSERVDGTSALQVGLDVMLQRRSKNPVAGMIMVDNAPSAFRRAAMDSVLGRAEAAGVPIHCFGVGAGHDPSSLWRIASQTLGTYTFIPRFNELRGALAGCVGSLLSVALTEVNVRVTMPAQNKMIVRRAAGATRTVVSADGKHVDVHLGTIYFGQVREVLLDIELNFDAVRKLVRRSSSSAPESLWNSQQRSGSAVQGAAGSLGASDNYLAQFGFDTALLEPSTVGPDIAANIPFDVMEEVVVLEADISFQDPATLHMAKRLGMGGPRTLSVEVDVFRPDHLSSLSPATVAALARASVTRRRFEILSHEMITRALLLASRHNNAQAVLLLQQTCKMLKSVLEVIPDYATPDATPPGALSSESGTTARPPSSRTEHGNPLPSGLTAESSTAASTMYIPQQDGHNVVLASLSAVVEDVNFLLSLLTQDWEDDPVLRDGMSVRSGVRPSSVISKSSLSSLRPSPSVAPGASAFEQQGRQYAAQQAMVLFQQTAWTRRTPTEHLRFRADNGPALAALAGTDPASL